MMAQMERRKHRRLEMRLPLEYHPAGRPGCACRTVTLNISTGGMYFETDLQDLSPGEILEFELTVPPGDGHFPYTSRVLGVGEVVRLCPIEPEVPGQARRRLGVAARFREPLRLAL